VTSAIQTQINAKSPTASPTFTGTVTVPSPFTLGATSVTATGAELNYVAGVTSAIQTQINSKEPTITQGSVLATELEDNSTSPDSTKYYRGDGKWIVPPGGGDVAGPASSTDSAIVLFDGTGGKNIKDSTYTITAAGAAVLDDVDAAAQRTTLGLGTIATQASDNVSITGGTITGVTMAAKQNADADLTKVSDAAETDKILYKDDNGDLQTVGLGTSGTFLKSQGAGSAPTWSTVSATPGGSNTHVQFNDGGAFGGDSGITYNKTTDTLTIDNTLITGSIQTTAADNTHFGDFSNTSNPDLSDGQIAYDKTKEILEASDETDDYVLATKIDPIQWSYASPDSNAVHYIQVIRKSNVTNFWCLADPGDTGESITVTVKECDSAGDSCADNGISVAADNDGTDDTSFSDSVIDADDLLEVTYSTTDTITSVNCTLERWRE
jgi:hypothetical protein